MPIERLLHMERELRWRAEKVGWLPAPNHAGHSFLKNMEEK